MDFIISERVTPLVAYIPPSYDIGESYMKDAERAHGRSLRDELHDGVALLEGRLGRVCEKRGVGHINLRTALERADRNGEGALYFENDLHLTELGQGVAARQILEWMVGSLTDSD